MAPLTSDNGLAGKWMAPLMLTACTPNSSNRFPQRYRRLRQRYKRPGIRSGGANWTLPDCQNMETSCSTSIWNRPGIFLNRGIAKMRISAAAISRTAVTTMPEISPGFTFFRPNSLHARFRAVQRPAWPLELSPERLEMEPASWQPRESPQQ